MTKKGKQKMTKDSLVTLRLDDTIKQVIQRLAAGDNRSMSNYIHHVLEEHIREELKKERQPAIAEILAASERLPVVDRAALARQFEAHLGQQQSPSVVTPSDEQPRRKIGKKCKAPAMLVVSVPKAIKK
jgi:hypothetical protein